MIFVFPHVHGHSLYPLSVSMLNSLLFIKGIPFLVYLPPSWLPLFYSTWRRDFLFIILCPWFPGYMILFQLLPHKLLHGFLNIHVPYFNKIGPPFSLFFCRPTILFVLPVLFYACDITQICLPGTTSLHCPAVPLCVCWTPPSPSSNAINFYHYF